METALMPERAGTQRLKYEAAMLGLYLAASLLMQFKSGPRVLDVPILAAVFYVYAGWLTLRLVRAIGRGL